MTVGRLLLSLRRVAGRLGGGPSGSGPRAPGSLLAADAAELARRGVARHAIDLGTAMIGAWTPVTRGVVGSPAAPVNANTPYHFA